MLFLELILIAVFGQLLTLIFEFIHSRFYFENFESGLFLFLLEKRLYVFLYLIVLGIVIILYKKMKILRRISLVVMFIGCCSFFVYGYIQKEVAESSLEMSIKAMEEADKAKKEIGVLQNENEELKAKFAELEKLIEGN